MSITQDRNAAERDFFNDAYARQDQALNGFYILSSAVRAFTDLVVRDCAGLQVLEFGCGPGGPAFELASKGALVTGIDISDIAVERARERAAGHPGLTFRVGDAEALPFPPGSFDLVCGKSILHHLDLQRAVQEIRRILRPGGRAAFYEPVGYNPAANLYRWLTPQLHTEDEHPLVRRDFELIRQAFPATRLQFFDLFSVAAIPFLRSKRGVALLRGMEALDRMTIRLVPPIRLLANVVIIEMNG